jgi:hypothetical protein
VEEPIVVHRIGRAWINLFEAPLLYVAISVLIFLLKIDDATFANLGWAFVAFRIAHYLVFVTVNHVLIRFILFAFSLFITIAMTLRTVILVW